MGNSFSASHDRTVDCTNVPDGGRRIGTPAGGGNPLRHGQRTAA